MGFFDYWSPTLGFGQALAGKDKGEGGETVTAQPMMPDFQLQTGKDLSEWVRKYLAMYSPGEKYPGQLSAPMSGIERTGLDQLGGFMGRPATGDLYSAAKGQVMDTLGGRYADPASSPFIKSMIGLAKQNLGDQITTARGQRGARGTYFTKAGIQEESRLGERTQNAMNAIIGEFQNAERGRQVAAVPQAQDLEQYSNLTAPLSRITASQILGSLERTLSQADLERQYDDYKRGRTELGSVPATALGTYGTQVPYGLQSVTMPKQGNGGLMSSLGSIASMIPTIFGGQQSGGFQGAGAANYPELYGQGGALNGGSANTNSQFLSTIMRYLPMILAAV